MSLCAQGNIKRLTGHRPGRVRYNPMSAGPPVGTAPLDVAVISKRNKYSPIVGAAVMAA